MRSQPRARCRRRAMQLNDSEAHTPVRRAVFRASSLRRLSDRVRGRRSVAAILGLNLRVASVLGDLARDAGMKANAPPLGRSAAREYRRSRPPASSTASRSSLASMNASSERFARRPSSRSSTMSSESNAKRSAMLHPRAFASSSRLPTLTSPEPFSIFEMVARLRPDRSASSTCEMRARARATTTFPPKTSNAGDFAGERCCAAADMIVWCPLSLARSIRKSSHPERGLRWTVQSAYHEHLSNCQL